jgi:hypothetical protein
MRSFVTASAHRRKTLQMILSGSYEQLKQCPLHYLGGHEFGLSDRNRGGPDCLNRFSASISEASARVRLPSGVAAG